MKLLQTTVGHLETNCYILFNEDTKNAIIIDPGGDSDKIDNILTENKLHPLYIINTHGHADHILGNNYFKEKYSDIILMIHENDAEMILSPTLNLSIMSGIPFVSCKADKLLKDNDIIDFDDKQIKVLHTPGHTKGCICIYVDEILISGDTLFQYSIGRTDLPGGSSEEILKHIREKLLSLPDDVYVYPGHGPESKIKDEKRMNMFF